MEKLALFCSGSGTNAQAILDYFAGHAHIQVACLVANNPRAYALDRAQQAGVPCQSFSRSQFYDTDQVDTFLSQHRATAIILAGFLWLVPPRLLAQYPARVLNIHPALLPAFGGPGMYGHHVHEAVAAAQAPESGITIHLADEAYDRGRILHQARVPLAAGSTPTQIESAVRALELQHYAPAIEAYFNTFPV
jgi:phosphoribosylglycinamide formyltransferase-1